MLATNSRKKPWHGSCGFEMDLRMLKMWDRLGRTCGGELHAVIKRREHREDEVMDALASGSLKE